MRLDDSRAKTLFADKLKTTRIQISYMTTFKLARSPEIKKNVKSWSN